MSLPVVASLWIGERLSFLEQLCLKSFADHGHRTLLYSYAPVAGLPDGVEPADANAVMPAAEVFTHSASGSPALHSDAFRYRLAQITGAIWIDADVLCLRPWRFDGPFVFGWEKPGKLICGAVLGLPPDSRTLARLLAFCSDPHPIPPWYPANERAQLAARRDGGDPVPAGALKWGVWGPDALTHFLRETGEIGHALPQMAFYPVSFRDRRDLLAPGDPVTPGLTGDCMGVHLWNRRLRRRIVTHEGNRPDPGSFLGRALARHAIAPAAAPIPDEPPPGFPTMAERAAQAAGRPARQPAPAAPRPAPPQAGPVGPPPALRAAPIATTRDSPRFQAAIDRAEAEGDARFGYLPDPPAPQRDDRVLIVTGMRNEAPHILEWVAYHLAIGVTHFLVYTNDCDDATDALLDRLATLGHVTRRPNPARQGQRRQHAIFNACPREAVCRDADWIVPIDCDEFINVHVGAGHLSDLFAAANRPNMISITWKFFGSAGVTRFEDRPVIEQFTRCAPRFLPKPRLGWGFKTMYHNALGFAKPGTHVPRQIDPAMRDRLRWVNGSGRTMPADALEAKQWMSNKATVGYRLVTLNHYVLRSAEAYLVKRDRGRINHQIDDQGLYYWVRRNYNSEEDRRMRDRAALMRPVLDRLMADAELARLHAEGVAWHRERTRQLLERPDYRHLYDEITSGNWPDPVTLGKHEAITLVKDHPVEGFTRHWFGTVRRDA
jgi:hypothetical protein